MTDHDADFDDVYADLETYGHLFGTQAQAEKTVADLRQRVAAIRSEREGKPRLTAARIAFIGEDLYTSGKQSMEQTQMDTVGLEYAFGTLLADKAFAQVSTEKVLELDPDVLILTYGHVEGETFADAEKKFLGLPGVSVRAGSGQVVGLIGPNGSGKTTLLRTLYRALSPKAGLVTLDDTPIEDFSTGDRARRLAVVVQEGRSTCRSRSRRWCSSGARCTDPFSRATPPTTITSRLRR